VKRLVVALVLTAALVLAAVLAPVPAGAQAACGFQLGFKAIANQIGTEVGRCLEDEHFNPANGNAEQRTTAHHGNGGLLVWRKADNWTAFTDGYWTWVNGPNGLQKRLNTERFDFEAPAPAAAPLTPDRFVAQLQTSGMPVTATVVHTPESDPNKLLGRPGQYTGKINWTDTRTGAAAQGDATIELFADRQTLDARKAYVEPFTKTSLFAQYLYAHPTRLALMRLPHELTPEQAKQYEDWFNKL
jgi:hypothetical protein